MQSLKNLIKTSLLVCLAVVTTFAAIISTSCNRDKCRSTLCANGGVCTNGACTCSIGYQGANCTVVSRLVFIGNWQAQGKSSASESAQYPVSIVAGNSAINNIMIENFQNYFTSPISAYVVNDSLYIPSQQVQGKSIFGSGQIKVAKYPAYTTIVINTTATDLTTNITTTETDVLTE